MSVKALLEQLKLSVTQRMYQGEFLLSTNTLGSVQFGDITDPDAEKAIRDILADVCRHYIDHHPGTYLLVNLEEFSEDAQEESSTTVLLHGVVRRLALPNLQACRVIVDPDSFDVFLGECPEKSRILIFAGVTTPHDLLLGACQNLHLLGHDVTGIFTIVESPQLGADTLRETLGVDVIPFLVYNPGEGTLSPVPELVEAVPSL